MSVLKIDHQYIESEKLAVEDQQVWGYTYKTGNNDTMYGVIDAGGTLVTTTTKAAGYIVTVGGALVIGSADAEERATLNFVADEDSDYYSLSMRFDKGNQNFQINNADVTVGDFWVKTSKSGSSIGNNTVLNIDGIFVNTATFAVSDSTINIKGHKMSTGSGIPNYDDNVIAGMDLNNVEINVDDKAEDTVSAKVWLGYNGSGRTLTMKDSEIKVEKGTVVQVVNEVSLTDSEIEAGDLNVGQVQWKATISKLSKNKVYYAALIDKETGAVCQTISFTATAAMGGDSVIFYLQDKKDYEFQLFEDESLETPAAEGKISSFKKDEVDASFTLTDSKLTVENLNIIAGETLAMNSNSSLRLGALTGDGTIEVSVAEGFTGIKTVVDFVNNDATVAMLEKITVSQEGAYSFIVKDGDIALASFVYVFDDITKAPEGIPAEDIFTNIAEAVEYAGQRGIVISGRFIDVDQDTIDALESGNVSFAEGTLFFLGEGVTTTLENANLTVNAFVSAAELVEGKVDLSADAVVAGNLVSEDVIEISTGDAADGSAEIRGAVSSDKEVSVENSKKLAVTGSVTGSSINISNADNAVIDGGSDDYKAQFKAEETITFVNNGHVVVDMAAKDIAIQNNSTNTITNSVIGYEGDAVVAETVVIDAAENADGVISNSKIGASKSISIADQTITATEFNGNLVFTGDTVFSDGASTHSNGVAKIFNGATVTVEKDANVTIYSSKQLNIGADLYTSNKIEGITPEGSGKLEISGTMTTGQVNVNLNSSAVIKDGGKIYSGVFKTTSGYMTPGESDKIGYVEVQEGGFLQAKHFEVEGGGTADIAGQLNLVNDSTNNYSAVVKSGGTVNVSSTGSITSYRESYRYSGRVFENGVLNVNGGTVTFEKMPDKDTTGRFWNEGAVNLNSVIAEDSSVIKARFTADTVTNDGALSINGSSFSVVNGMTNNDTVFVSGASALNGGTDADGAVKAMALAGNGVVYIEDATLDANTNIAGSSSTSNVRFVKGTSTVTDSKIVTDGFQVGEKSETANLDTENDVEVTFGGNAVLDVNGDDSDGTFGGWIGTQYTSDFSKFDTEKTARYKLNITGNTNASFDYLHVWADGELSVSSTGEFANTSREPEAHFWNFSENSAFYANRLIANGKVEFNGTSAWIRSIYVSVDNTMAGDNAGSLVISNSTLDVVGGNESSTTFIQVRNYGKLSIDNGSSVMIRGYMRVDSNAEASITSSTLTVRDEIRWMGAITLTGAVMATDALKIGADFTVTGLAASTKYGFNVDGVTMEYTSDANGQIKFGTAALTDGTYDINFVDKSTFGTVSKAVTISNGSLTMDYASTVKFNTLDAAAESITIDTDGYTTGTYLVMDAADAVDYANYITTDLDATVGEAGKFIVANGDLYLTDAKQDILYVNSTYTAETAAAEGKILGYNAFNTMQAALDVLENGPATLNITGETADTTASVTLTEGGEYVISGGNGNFINEIFVLNGDKEISADNRIRLEFDNADIAFSKFGEEKVDGKYFGNYDVVIEDSTVSGKAYATIGSDAAFMTVRGNSTFTVTNSLFGFDAGTSTAFKNLPVGAAKTADADLLPKLDSGIQGVVAMAYGDDSVSEITGSTAAFRGFEVGCGADVTVDDSVIYLSGGMNIGAAYYGAGAEDKVATVTVTNGSIVRDLEWGSWGGSMAPVKVGMEDAILGSALLRVEDGSVFAFSNYKNETAVEIGAKGAVEVEDATFETSALKINNGGAFTVSSTEGKSSTLNIGGLTGAISVTGTLADSKINGGTVVATGKTAFTGTTVVNTLDISAADSDLTITGNFTGGNVYTGYSVPNDSVTGTGKLTVGDVNADRTTAKMAQLAGFGTIAVANADVDYHYSFIRSGFSSVNSTLEIDDSGINTYFSSNAVAVIDSTTWYAGSSVCLGSYDCTNYAETYGYWGNADVTIQNLSTFTAGNLTLIERIWPEKNYTVKMTVDNATVNATTSLKIFEGAELIVKEKGTVSAGTVTNTVGEILVEGTGANFSAGDVTNTGMITIMEGGSFSAADVTTSSDNQYSNSVFVMEGRFTASGDMTNSAGCMSVYDGEFTVGGTLTNSGSITVENSVFSAGTVDNNGTIAVDGGTFKADVFNAALKSAATFTDAVVEIGSVAISHPTDGTSNWAVENIVVAGDSKVTITNQQKPALIYPDDPNKTDRYNCYMSVCLDDDTTLLNGTNIGGSVRVRSTGDVTFGKTAEDVINLCGFDNMFGYSGYTYTVNGTLNITGTAAEYVPSRWAPCVEIQGNGSDRDKVSLLTGKGAINSTATTIFEYGNITLDEDLEYTLSGVGAHLRFSFNVNMTIKGKFESTVCEGDILNNLQNATVTVTGTKGKFITAYDLNVGYNTYIVWSPVSNQYKSALKVEDGGLVDVSGTVRLNVESSITVSNATFSADAVNFQKDATFTVAGVSDVSGNFDGAITADGAVTLSSANGLTMAGLIDGAVTYGAGTFTITGTIGAGTVDVSSGTVMNIAAAVADGKLAFDDAAATIALGSLTYTGSVTRSGVVIAEGVDSVAGNVVTIGGVAYEIGAAAGTDGISVNWVDGNLVASVVIDDDEMSGETVTDVNGNWIYAGADAEAAGIVNATDDLTLNIELTANDDSKSRVFGGKQLIEDSTIQGGIQVTEVVVDGMGIGNGIYGGNRVLEGATLTGYVQNTVEVNAAADAVFGGQIAGGSFVVNGAMSTTGTTSVAIAGDASAVYNSTVVGGSYVSNGSSAYNNGNSEVTIDAGIFNKNIYGGGYVQNNGQFRCVNTSITINGGEFNGKIYGGNGEAASCTKDNLTLVENTTYITINGGKFNANIYGGSFGLGKVNGSSTIEIFEGEFGKIVIDGDSSNADYYKKEAVEERNLIFNGYDAALDASFRNFDTVKFLNDADIDMTNGLFDIAEVDTWSFENGASVVGLGDVEFDSDDTLEIYLDKFVANAADGDTWTIMSGSSIDIADLDNVIANIDGGLGYFQKQGDAAWTYGDYTLSLEDGEEKDSLIVKKATIA